MVYGYIIEFGLFNTFDLSAPLNPHLKAILAYLALRTKRRNRNADILSKLNK